MKATLKLGNIAFQRTLTATLVSIDEASHTTKIEINGITFDLVGSDPDNELKDLVGKKISVTPEGAVSSAAASASTKTEDTTRRSGCSKNESKNMREL